MMRAMRTLLLVSTMVLAISGTAAAQQSGGHGPGVGIEQTLGGLTGATFSYDASSFHIDIVAALVHFSSEGADATRFGLAGRFFFTLHDMGAADFSLGGGLGLVREDEGEQGDTQVHIEGAAQIRVFLVPNVAITGSLGLVILTADEGVGGGPIAGGGSGETVFGFGGQLNGAFGLIYYFR
jgi:hypothetical protein